MIDVPGDKVHTTDVLVVGGGITAMFAACRSRELGCEVTLVDKARPGRSGCTAVASGVFHYYTREDDEDTIVRGLTSELTNQPLFKRTLYETEEAMGFMRSAGVKFVEESGRVARVGGPRLPFPHSAMMASGGPQMALALRAETLRRGVRVEERVIVTNLLTSDGCSPTSGSVIGAVGFGTRTGQCHIFWARAVIMCTGPFGIPYNRYDTSFSTRTMPVDAGGEGLAAMYRAGAVMGKLEMGYRTPGPPEFTNAPGLEMFTALGGHTVWINRLGERFLTSEFRNEDFGRSSITTAILRENFRGRGPAGVNVSHFTPEQRRLLAQVIPIIVANFESAGYDLATDTVPYSVGAPGGKGVNGAGARIDDSGRTSVPGLFAAGNCSDGAYVCLGQALDTCAITGWWAARGATAYADAAGRSRPEPRAAQLDEFKDAYYTPLKTSSEVKLWQARDRMTDIQISLTPTLNGRNIAEGRGELARLMGETMAKLSADTPRELARVASVKAAAPIMDLVLAVLDHRTESRGNLIRDDYPHIDNDKWLTHTVVQRDGGVEYTLWDELIPSDWWLVPPRSGRRLHPFFVQHAEVSSNAH